MGDLIRTGYYVSSPLKTVYVFFMPIGIAHLFLSYLAIPGAGSYINVSNSSQLLFLKFTAALAAIHALCYKFKINTVTSDSLSSIELITESFG